MKGLTPIQYQALSMLAAGDKPDIVAKMTGVSRRTIDRWCKDPEFDRVLRESVAKTFDIAIATLVNGSVIAAEELRRIISNPDVATKTRVTAINVLLTTAARAKDSVLEHRLEQLEGTIDGSDTEQD